MTTGALTAGGGHARYTFRPRLSSTAVRVLEAEWARCRWVWNESVAKSKAVHLHNEATGEKTTCGPAQLDKMLTAARTVHAWLREGSSVVRQQLIRDFAKSRVKALKDIKAQLPMRQRAGMPKCKKKHQVDPSLNYTQRGSAHTTMDCAHCDARAKHRLSLSERTYTCTACGTVSPRDKNSARVMLVRAGLNPASGDLVSPATC
ncbi:zinc ribbon domain-containing protein [Streptomyces sp. NPDC051956]|uniref:zinc ribbon domain-containing protein n=1 Tax=Streptomyces sp. NPDC051956 TaxID=3365677 RepID=UPI0037D0D29E